MDKGKKKLKKKRTVTRMEKKENIRQKERELHTEKEPKTNEKNKKGIVKTEGNKYKRRE